MIKKLNPAIVRKIWGGTKLEKMKGLSSQGNDEPIGETLEVFEKELSYLVKFIDTSEELSIQVHPDDEYARLHENSSGKTECWIILSAAPGAGIYLGLRPEVGREDLESALKNKRPINELLNFYPVERGDFFYVPAGSIHAIGKDITLAEVQQNSGITYRVWDWGRVDDKGIGRELHIEKSLDVINFDPHCNDLQFFRAKKNLTRQKGQLELVVHPEFHLFLVNLEKGETHSFDLSGAKRPSAVLNLEGDLEINQEILSSYGACLIENENGLEFKAIHEGSFLIIC